MWNAEINRYAIDFAFCFRSAIHVIIHLIFIGTKTPQYDREVIERSFWLQISFFAKVVHVNMKLENNASE